jgi:hypothetical protein
MVQNMILILRTTKVTECILLDTIASEATFIFRQGYSCGTTNDLLGKTIPEGGANPGNAEVHIAYHNRLQVAYDTAFPNDFVNCTDTATHGHYTVSGGQCETFYTMMLVNKATFDLTQAPFKPGGAIMAFSPPA